MKFEKYSLIIGHWQDAPVRLHWTILPFAFIITGFKYHPVYIVAYLGLIFIHEMGHAIVVRFYNFKVHELLIHGFGGSCFWSGFATKFQESLIAWAGIIAQVIIFLFFNFSPYFIDFPKNSITESIFYVFIGPNLFIILINLLPIEPFDGAQAWKIFSPLRDLFINKKQVSTENVYNEIVKREIQEIIDSNISAPNKTDAPDRK